MDDTRNLAEKLDELLRLQKGDPEAQPTVGQLWNSWEAGMRTTKSEGTIKSIASARKHLEPRVFHFKLVELDGEWWATKFIPDVRLVTGNNEFKFFNIRKWTSMFLKWADENRKGPKDWRRPRLIDPDPEVAAGRAYSIEETTALMFHADWLLKPKIVMALEHFMRRSEIAFLAKERVDRKKQIIYLRAQDTKIRKARSFPYNDNLEKLFIVIDDHYAKLNSPWVFPSPKDISISIGRDGFSSAWATCKRLAGVVGRFHWLRHTALTRAFKASGSNPALICEMAGLQISEAQKTYLHFEIDDMRSVLK
jgi:hypothetical protein